MTTKTKKVKKVDVKKEAKLELSALFAEFLESKGIEVDTRHEEYGFTAGTLVVRMEKTDVQVKLITPKAGLDRYMVVEEEVEDSSTLSEEV